MDALDAKVAANTAAHFPPDLLRPWQERVAAALPRWRAYMLPVLPAQPGERMVPVIWTLERRGEADAMHDPPRYRIVFEGVDRDRLVDAAENFDRAYI